MIDYKKALQLRRKYTSLSEIAKKLGCSHEAVRKTLKRHGVWAPLFIERREFAVTHTEMSADEVAAKLGIHKATVYQYRKEMQFALKRGTQAYVSQAYKEEVSRLLDLHGVKNTLAQRGERHALTLENGKRVAVLFRTHPDRKEKDQFLFGVRKNDWGDYCDYFILIAGSIERTYIIPNDELPDKCQGVSIPANPPSRSRLLQKTSKYRQYLNRFDLLQEAKAGTA